MLVHRLRRWPIINPTFGKRLVFAVVTGSEPVIMCTRCRCHPLPAAAVKPVSHHEVVPVEQSLTILYGVNLWLKPVSAID